MNVLEIKNAPLIPITETVIYPGISTRIFVNDDIGNNIKELIVKNNTLAIGLSTKDYKGLVQLTADSFFRIGVLMKFDNIQKSDTGFVIDITTINRVKIYDFTFEEKQITASYSDQEDIMDITEAEQQEMILYIKGLMKDLSNKFKGAEYFISILEGLPSLEELMGYTVPMMGIPLKSKQDLLEIDSIKERTLNFIDYIVREKDSVHLQLEISKKYSQRKDKSYREAMLREQLKNIKAELGEMDGDVEEDEDYRTHVLESDMPEDVKKIALKEVHKLENTPPNSGEGNVIMNYLDLLLEMPWVSEKKEIDIEHARKVLDSHHYGIDDVKKRIIEHLAVMKLKEDKQGSILLLVGPPGTGKTSLGKSIAEAIDRKYVRASLGGVRDEAEIRGHRKTYLGAMPGRIIKGICNAEAKNPVFVLDEIDKMGISNQGDPGAALLEVLDPEQNNSFSDHYLEIPYDLSDVFFIATANDLSTIPAPLLDRAEIIELSSYTNGEKKRIAIDHLLPKVLEEHGLTDQMLQIEETAIEAIIENYTAEAGVRGLTKQLAKISRFVSEKIVSKTAELPFIVTTENLSDVLGNKTRRHEKAGENNKPGVVTGMAWTTVGGEILFIEASLMPGSGKLTLTGQLGDVMQESATIAMSLIRSHLGELANGFDYFKYDTHIHVPSGSTPKDGPSAGVALTTALASLILGKQVDSKLSMTGEITLSGQVLPVGGIKEKVIAAQRSGIKTILLPKDNERDVPDIPDEVRNELTFKYVSSIEDVFKEALGIELPEPKLVLNRPNMEPKSQLNMLKK
ncbi:endopeptidase La [Acetobacterium paludosum]|uniref:Lon protease n=1 Tax=Acetobacterium paludosum TaxID=52693 RepID=A0A923HS67_9FIRM|nr:endopeptidase La [Acetobacterium paludosum]MBC3887678.1 endopeptidase La [Acetobacterium paludosum]